MKFFFVGEKDWRPEKNLVTWCWFWTKSMPNLFPQRREQFPGSPTITKYVRWCAKKKTITGALRNGLKYLYKGCYTLNINVLASPSGYRDKPDQLGKVYTDRVYNVGSCADKCQDHAHYGFETTLSHWSNYHSRYFGIAGESSATLPTAIITPCKNHLQWVRDNFQPGARLWAMII